jgi:hypothetical protein
MDTSRNTTALERSKDLDQLGPANNETPAEIRGRFVIG